MLCQGENHYHDSTMELIRIILFYRVILYCRMLTLLYFVFRRVLQSLGVILRSPSVAPTCYLNKGMFFLKSP